MSQKLDSWLPVMAATCLETRRQLVAGWLESMVKSLRRRFVYSYHSTQPAAVVTWANGWGGGGWRIKS